MATSTPLKDLEENFFLCPVCLEIYQDPKLLPCLHRYCGKCLGMVVNASCNGTVKCPVCTQECDVPDNGIDGFKTDFHMKSVVEFIELQRKFENKDIEECMSCSNQTKVSTFCYKCKDFLCEQCYNVHISSEMFTDHKPHTLKLDNTDGAGRKITLNELETLTEDPRCRTHVDEIAKLCCSTCENEPICTICTYSEHKGHDLHDVTELAKTERELLGSKIAELQKLKSKLHKLPKNVEAAKQKLNKNIAKKTDVLINQHKRQVNKIKNQLEERRKEKKGGLADIEKRRKAEEWQTNLDFEEEINKVNKKYDEIWRALERKYNSECQLLKDSCEKNESELVSKLESLDIYLKRLTESKDLLKERRNMELAKISDNCDQVIKRYENFTAIASSIVASRDEWAQVQSIPDIRAACEPLIEEMRKEQQLDSLSDIHINDLPNLILGDVTISGQEQTVVDVEGLKAMGGRINGIASSRNGDIVVSGFVSRQSSHITVINRRGKIQRQDQIKRAKEHELVPARFCCYLSESKIATVCIPDEIGIYNVRNGSYERKYIRDVIREWPVDRLVWCVANDPIKNHIIVGTCSRYVYAFDDQLNYIRTITLPDETIGVNDVTVHGDTLLICDKEDKRAYAVNVAGSENKLMYEFTKPDHAGSNAQPFRVCSDKNDFIYMLWREFVSDMWTYTLVHYSQNGRRLLTTRTIDNDAICLATLKVFGSEKLLIATLTSRMMYEYGIKVT